MSRYISPWKYQFDPSGTLPANLIVDENKVLSASGHLPFPVNEGTFYTDSVVVKKQGVATPLVPGTDYTFDGLDAYATALTGKEVATVIDITDKTSTGTFEITYQCVGGAEGQPIGILSDLLDAIAAATSTGTINFATDIENLPIAYPPEPHGHPLSSMEELDLLSQVFRETHNALINRIPMVNSGNHLQQQIDRILGVIGSIRNSVNEVVAVQGSSQQIQDILDSLANLEQVATAEVSANAGQSTLIAEYDLTEISGVTGALVFVGAVESEMLNFNILCRETTVPKVTYSGRIGATGNIMDVQATRVGTTLRITCTCTDAGNVKAKVLAAL